MDEREVFVRVDDEGIVRIEGVDVKESFLLDKKELEAILTRLYEFALRDVKASEGSR